MLILPTKSDSSEYYDGVIYLTNNDEFMFHHTLNFYLPSSKAYIYKYRKPYKKCKQMFDKYGQFSVWDPSLKHGTKIVKPSTVLYVQSYSNIEHFHDIKRIQALFSANCEFWKSRFTNFNAENYPEYFI